MSFIQVSFAYFLPIVHGLWTLVRDRYLLSVPLLLVASLVFYGHRQWWVLSVILGYASSTGGPAFGSSARPGRDWR